MMLYEIPLQSTNQKLTIALGPKNYRLRVFWAGMWAMDISDDDGTPLVCGIALVDGADLLEQYPDLGIPGRLWLISDSGAGDLTADNLGVSWHLYFEPSGGGTNNLGLGGIGHA